MLGSDQGAVSRAVARVDSFRRRVRNNPGFVIKTFRKDVRQELGADEIIQICADWVRAEEEIEKCSKSTLHGQELDVGKNREEDKDKGDKDGGGQGRGRRGQRGPSVKQER